MAAAAKIAMSSVAPSHRQGGSTRALLTPSSVGATSGELGTRGSIALFYRPA